MGADVKQRGPVLATRRLGQFAWCSYDWANSAFPTVIVTFVFAAYFTKGVAADEVVGTSQWSYAVSLSMLATAVLGPFLGAIADHGGRRKPWVLAFTLVMAGSTAALWFATPKIGDVWWVLLCFALANFAFETGTIFYNAMLPSISPPAMIGRLSGWGWGLGYGGGLVCLVVTLFVLIRPDPPLFGLEAALAQPVRASALLVAGWLLAFSLPFFLLTPDAVSNNLRPGEAMRRGASSLVSTFRHLRRYRNVGLFLISHMVYTDGLNTLFSVGGIYAAVTFGMDLQELLLFGIALNVTAGLGAFAFGWVDDRIGPKPTILIALGAIIVLGAGILLVETKPLFWAFALPIGIFLGPAQSASRSMMARISPPDVATEMFGLFAFSGKATAFMGPAIFGWMTWLSGSQRIGLSSILLFLLAGAALLGPVRQVQAPEGGECQP
ncbi:MAG: MFS transporter [Rhodospirillales bacterium]|nr:MFS transporter [Rhodospirillales bacterium]